MLLSLHRQSLHLAVLSALVRVIVASTGLDDAPLTANDLADHWIVTLNDGVDLEAHVSLLQDLHAHYINRTEAVQYTGESHRYDGLSWFQGYSGHFHPSVVDHLRAHSDVASVEPDLIMSVTSAPMSAGPEVTTQSAAPWNLVQISHRAPNSGSDYVYDKTGGRFSIVYVLDSGILASHTEFDRQRGRVQKGINVVKDEAFTDLYGHGTHVAAIIGGKTYGVAKTCDFYDVKVINRFGQGRLSATLKGLSWAVKAITGSTTQDISVINMSVSSTGWSPALNRALTGAAKKGVTAVVAAGNNAEETFATKSAIVVGAADEKRARPAWSNYGDRVTLFAPAVKIKSAWIGAGNSATLVASGTSQAAPHVAGVVALVKSEQKMKGIKVATSKRVWSKKVSLADEMKAAIMKMAIPNAVADGRSGTNSFLYNGSGK